MSESLHTNEKTTTERIEKIEKRLERMEVKLDALLEKMEISVKECNKMGEHIDFIENVYETVKMPLTFICDKVNIFSGNQETNSENSLEDVNPINHRLIENE